MAGDVNPYFGTRYRRGVGDVKAAIVAFNAANPILSVVGAGRFKRMCGTRGGEWHGPCPLCGGTDRCYAHPYGPKGARAYCRQCWPRGGDALDWSMRIAGIDPAIRGARGAFLRRNGYVSENSSSTVCPPSTPSCVMPQCPKPDTSIVPAASPPQAENGTNDVPEYPQSVIAALSGDVDLLVAWAERAAIMEFDGGLPRGLAGLRALQIQQDESQ